MIDVLAAMVGIPIPMERPGASRTKLGTVTAALRRHV
jgi:hypothetical protein